MIVSAFMSAIFDRTRRKRVIENAGKILAQISTDGVSLVGSGTSGAIIISTLAHHHDLPCTIVRKEPSHSDLLIEGEVDFDSFIIVDDNIDSGHTVEHIMSIIEDQNPQAKLEGILLYAPLCPSEQWEERFDCWVRHI